VPIVTINSSLVPQEALMVDIVNIVSSVLGVDQSRVWVFHNTVKPGTFLATPWSLPNVGGALLNFRCKSHYKDHLVREAVSETVRLIKDHLNIEDSAVLAIVDRVPSGQLFVNGEFWNDTDSIGKSASITLNPIGIVHNDRTMLSDDNWGSVKSLITLDASVFTEESLLGLEEFSHLECIFQLHRVAENEVHTGARHPRNNKALPRVGILAQRPKARPNRIGLSVCRILRVNGLSVEVQGLDAIDGTPILDIKPYFVEFGPESEPTQPEWVSTIMQKYFN
jgi:tRNA-Thr(GGU) m(6)t(6)A37 methyltransferase TsaA